MATSYIRSRVDGETITDPERPVWVQHLRVTVRWTNPNQWLDCGGAEFGVRGADSTDGLKLHGLRLQNAGHGTRLTNLTGELLGCNARKCGGEGFQGGGQLILAVEDCDSRENGWGRVDWGSIGIGPNRAHGYYFECRGSSWDSPGLQMRRCVGDRNNGMGLHLRGQYLLVEGCEFTRNAPGDDNAGAGNVQLTSASYVILRRCLLEDGDSGLTLYAEPTACEDVLADDCAIWQPADAFAVSAWEDTVLRVRRGVVCGRLDRTQPVFSSPDIYFPTGTPEARAALAAWKGGTPEPEPPPDLAAENALLKADNIRLRTLLSDIEILAGQR